MDVRVRVEYRKITPAGDTRRFKRCNEYERLIYIAIVPIKLRDDKICLSISPFFFSPTSFQKDVFAMYSGVSLSLFHFSS